MGRVRQLAILQAFVRNLRFGLRVFRRNPGFTAGVAPAAWLPARKATKASPVEAMR